MHYFVSLNTLGVWSGINVLSFVGQVFTPSSSFPSYSNISTNQLKLPESQKYELSDLGNWTKKNCLLPTLSAIPPLEELTHKKFSSRKLVIRKMFWKTAPWKTTSWGSLNHENCPSYIFWKFHANTFTGNIKFLFSCIILN